MNPIRLLGKMTAQGLLIDGSGFGGGSVLITQHDVAGAMGMGDLPAEAELVESRTIKHYELVEE